jgi:hypothetical protein
MHSSLLRHTMRSRAALVASALACTLALAACGSDSTGPAPRAASTTYDGVVIMDGVGGGTLDLVFDSPQARVVGTGTSSIVTCSVVCGTFLGVSIDGGTVDGDSVTFHLSWYGYDVTAGGRIKGGRFNGTFIGVQDPDTVKGSFTVYATQEPADVQLYCGYWETGTDDGPWYFFVAGSEVVGYASFDGASGKLTGTFANDSVKVNSTFTLSSAPVTASLTATGHYVTPGDPSAIEGTFHAAAGGETEDGTWYGQDCSGAPARLTR